MRALGYMAIAAAFVGCGNIQLEPLRTSGVRGRIEAANPSQARVYLREPVQSADELTQTAVGADGRFELQGIAPGSHELFIESLADDGALLVPFDAPAGDIADLPEPLVLQPGAWLRLTIAIHRTETTPSGDVVVSMGSAKGGTVLVEGTRFLGQPIAEHYELVAGEEVVTLGPFAAGSYVARVEVPGIADVGQTDAVPLVAGQTAHRRIELSWANGDADCQELSCPGTKRCGPDGICGACASAQECDPAEMCHLGRCTSMADLRTCQSCTVVGAPTECGGLGECRAGAVPDENYCEFSCGRDGHCPRDAECVGGKCVPVVSKYIGGCAGYFSFDDSCKPEDPISLECPGLVDPICSTTTKRCTFRCSTAADCPALSTGCVNDECQRPEAPAP